MNGGEREKFWRAMGGKVLHWIPGTGRGILGLSVEV